MEKYHLANSCSRYGIFRNKKMLGSISWSVSQWEEESLSCKTLSNTIIKSLSTSMGMALSCTVRMLRVKCHQMLGNHLPKSPSKMPTSQIRWVWRHQKWTLSSSLRKCETLKSSESWRLKRESAALLKALACNSSSFWKTIWNSRSRSWTTSRPSVLRINWKS